MVERGFQYPADVSVRVSLATKEIRRHGRHMIQRAHHTGFVVRDLEKALRFYHDVVGLEVKNRVERTGGPISQVIGYENAHLQVAFLEVPGGHALELIQYVNPPPEERPTEERNVLGATHLALQVDDIDEMYQKLAARGARPINPPAEIVPGRTACYLQDPDGNWIELMELG